MLLLDYPLKIIILYYWASLVAQTVKCMPTPVLLPGKSHGQRSLVGNRLWGHKESDTTEQFYFTLYY